MPRRDRVEFYIDKSGGHRARLRGANNKIRLDFSESFDSRGNLKRAVKGAALALAEALIEGRTVVLECDE